MRRITVKTLLVAVLALSSLGMVACSPPPAITKAQIEAKTLPKRHPKLSAKQMANCRVCHKEAPAIRK